MKQTIRVQIESPLSNVKSRIDEIYSVIEKHSFIEPMISDGTRRALFADSVKNTEKVARILNNSVKERRDAEIPPLPVTNASPDYVTRKRMPPPSILKAESKIAVAIQQEARNRLERRKTNHRHCIPYEERSIRREEPELVPLSETFKETSYRLCNDESPRVFLEGNANFRSETSQSVIEDALPEQANVVVISPATELEKLISETEELLDREGNIAGILRDKDFKDDDLLAEIERDINDLSKKLGLPRPIPLGTNSTQLG